MKGVKLNLKKMMDNDETKGSMTLNIKKVKNGMIVNISANIQNREDSSINENSSGDYVYKGTPVQMKKEIDAELGIGGFFLDGSEKEEK